ASIPWSTLQEYKIQGQARDHVRERGGAALILHHNAERSIEANGKTKHPPAGLEPTVPNGQYLVR
ncbi:MAG: hypothetical protein KBA60_11060, partial [Flavobacteriales bacterium]|nr:hypothetical protein [Flavobacteriales bacterium]